MKTFGLLLDAEDIQLELRCAIKVLGLVVDSLEREVMAIKQAEGFVSVDYLQDLSDALYSVSGTMDDLNLKLETAVDEEYKRRGNKNAGIFGLN